MPTGMHVPNAHQLMFMPMWDPNSESLVTGPSQDDHDGGPAAGVSSGFDSSGGEPCYQFGNQWVRTPSSPKANKMLGRFKQIKSLVDFSMECAC